MKKAPLFLLAALASAGAVCPQQQHDRIASRGTSTFDAFKNTATVVITGATPSVANGNVFKTNNGSTTTITNFLGGTDSQQIVVLCGDTNTIIANGANISVAGGVNFSCSANVGISFVFDASQSLWIENGGTGTGGGSSPGAPANSLQKNNGSGGLAGAGISDNGSSITLSEPFSGAIQHNGSETFAIPIVITQTTGTSPLTVTSTTVVPNLNASLLNGNTFASPGTIGGTTPGAATFTTLTANTSLAINGGSALTTTNQSGTGNLCMVTSCAMTTPTLTNPSVSTGIFTSPALTTPTIGGETISAAPRGSYNAFLLGALTATGTGQTFTLDKGITVTRVQVQLRVAPSGCSTPPVVRVSDGTNNLNLTLSAAANDSGAVSQNFASGALLTIATQTAALGCTTYPGDANVQVQYKMQ